MLLKIIKPDSVRTSFCTGSSRITLNVIVMPAFSSTPHTSVAQEKGFMALVHSSFQTFIDDKNLLAIGCWHCEINVV